MTSFLDWSTTDATNASIGSINFSDGQLPSTLNDSARVLMGDAARWRNTISSALTATGTNTLVYTSGLSLTSYVQGQFFMFKNTTESTGPVTFNVDSIAAKSVVKHGDVALTAADLKANGIYVVAYESVNDRFQLLSPVSNQSATLAGAETLTNKTITAAVINGALSGSSFLDDDSMASATATTVASSESVKAYVDAVAVTTAAAMAASAAAAQSSEDDAQISEDAAAADVILTSADATQTALDRIATAANVVSTANDVLSFTGVTSSTSLAIAASSKAFAVSSGLSLQPGDWVLATSDANPDTNYMHGPISSYTGTTLTLNVDNIGGSGTFADWTIRRSGTQGTTGATGLTGATGPTGPVGVGLALALGG